MEALSGADLMAEALSTIGCQVTLQTQDGEELKGTIFGNAFEGSSQVVVLQQPGSTPFHNNIKILKQDQIKAVLDMNMPEELGIEPLPQVDAQRCQDREERAVRAAELEAAKIGVGVTEEAQLVFDAMAKTLPCKWDGKTIIVLSEVSITEPYGPDDCQSINPDDLTVLNRVKKVFLAERSKLFGGS